MRAEVVWAHSEDRLANGNLICKTHLEGEERADKRRQKDHMKECTNISSTFTGETQRQKAGFSSFK